MLNQLLQSEWKDQLKCFKHLDIKHYTGNPKAISAVSRCIDEDLNRCFDDTALKESASKKSYEAQRVQYFNQEFGPKDNLKMDYIIDLHTTTSNMGMSIVPSDLSKQSKTILKHVINNHPDIKILLGPYSDKSNQSYLISMAKFGFAIELGAVLGGAYVYQSLKIMHETLLALLESINNVTCDAIDEADDNLTAYRMTEKVYFPHQDNMITGLVHPDVKCYHPIHSGEPLLVDFNGKTMATNQASHEMYPVFINEPAFLDNFQAMILCEKILI